MSVEYYDRNADAFFAGTVDADMSEVRSRFLSLIPRNGHVLDAGCGSGRDALAFAKAGCMVTAFDASGEMVRLARQHTGLPVLQMTFDQVDWISKFDGVWASASLLHVERAKLPWSIGALARSLRANGVLYASMKRGEDEREVEGRVFTDVTEDELRKLFEDAGLVAISSWISADVRPGREDQHWVNAIGKCSAPLEFMSLQISPSVSNLHCDR